jgi:hypothetical protein
MDAYKIVIWERNGKRHFLRPGRGEVENAEEGFQTYSVRVSVGFDDWLRSGSMQTCISNIGNTPTMKKGIIPHKMIKERKTHNNCLRKTSNRLIRGERQKPLLPTARSPRRWWISRPKNLEDHTDHHEEIQICHISKVFITLNVLIIYDCFFNSQK